MNPRARPKIGANAFFARDLRRITEATAQRIRIQQTRWPFAVFKSAVAMFMMRPCGRTTKESSARKITAICDDSGTIQRSRNRRNGRCSAPSKLCHKCIARITHSHHGRYLAVRCSTRSLSR
jgi:hypothetical protein